MLVSTLQPPLLSSPPSPTPYRKRHCSHFNTCPCMITSLGHGSLTAVTGLQRDSRCRCSRRCRRWLCCRCARPRRCRCTHTLLAKKHNKQIAIGCASRCPCTCTLGTKVIRHNQCLCRCISPLGMRICLLLSMCLLLRLQCHCSIMARAPFQDLSCSMGSRPVAPISAIQCRHADNRDPL